MAEHHEEQLRQLVQEVRATIRTNVSQIIRISMLRYPVFLDAGNLIQGQATSKFLAFQTPDKHETNWYFQHKETGRTGPRSKAIQNAPFLCDLLLLAGPTVNVIPRQGRRVGARVALSTAMCSMHVSI